MNSDGIALNCIFHQKKPLTSKVFLFNTIKVGK